MTNKGFSHVNLATMDLDKTRDFYEGVLGFPLVAAGIYEDSGTPTSIRATAGS